MAKQTPATVTSRPNASGIAILADDHAVGVVSNDGYGEWCFGTYLGDPAEDAIDAEMRKRHGFNPRWQTEREAVAAAIAGVTKALNVPSGAQLLDEGLDLFLRR